MLPGFPSVGRDNTSSSVGASWRDAAAATFSVAAPALGSESTVATGKACDLSEFFWRRGLGLPPGPECVGGDGTTNLEPPIDVVGWRGAVPCPIFARTVPLASSVARSRTAKREMVNIYDFGEPDNSPGNSVESSLSILPPRPLLSECVDTHVCAPLPGTTWGSDSASTRFSRHISRLLLLWPLSCVTTRWAARVPKDLTLGKVRVRVVWVLLRRPGAALACGWEVRSARLSARVWSVGTTPENTGSIVQTHSHIHARSRTLSQARRSDRDRTRQSLAVWYDQRLTHCTWVRDIWVNDDHATRARGTSAFPSRLGRGSSVAATTCGEPTYLCVFGMICQPSGAWMRAGGVRAWVVAGPHSVGGMDGTVCYGTQAPSSRPFQPQRAQSPKLQVGYPLAPAPANT